MSDTYVSERFKSAVKDHKLKINLDQGLHRHITLSRPRSSVYRFDLVTWPGHLAISGDLDDFTFTRLPDMFDFFRFAGPEYTKSDRPNYGYWSEKCTSAYTRGKMMVFDEDLYLQAIKSDLESHTETMTPEEKTRCLHDAEECGLLDPANDTRSAIEQVIDWRCPVTGDCPLPEFYEHRLEDYSFGFKFTCHAIQWGIKQYDLAAQSRTQADHDKKVLEGAL